MDYTNDGDRREDRRQAAGAILRAVVWCWIVCGLGALFVGGIYGIINAFSPVIQQQAQSGQNTTAQSTPATAPQMPPAYATTPKQKRDAGQSKLSISDFSDYAQMLLYLDCVRQDIKHNGSYDSLEAVKQEANRQGVVVNVTQGEFEQASAELEDIRAQALKALDAIQQKYTLQAFIKDITGAQQMFNAISNVRSTFENQQANSPYSMFISGSELYTSEDGGEPVLQEQLFEPRDWWYFDHVDGDYIYYLIPKVSPTHDTFFTS